ncbi:TonB-dependent receptor [Alistipes sp. An116]|uniref:outer membrane beta-barrel protein n=1 Tax=Alistipes sp. An116 TaxID=1965546 RepID=UPI000B3A0551|nr:outer membrane beta-barrel protein [Alistipes sp. An116]OUQ52784.1 TonB-dependent receptor [Alistipes sp. An116]
MKKWIIWIVMIICAIEASAARLCPAHGRVVNEQGKAIEYATVVLLREGRQVAGMATDADGQFQLEAAPGQYDLQIQYLGCEPLKQLIRVEENNDLGDFVLRSSPTQIEGVVVSARLVRREADRFVVDVANAPAAIGKDGIDLLEQAPGVWIDGEKISINGKSGSKVYINDRELKMDNTQLLTYLRSLRAEEIQKIEVIPVTGADYDADSASGVIRITLKKRRENGLNGSVAFNTSQSRYIHTYDPSANINLHSGKVDFYSSIWGSLGNQRLISRENTRYNASGKNLQAISNARHNQRNYGINAGSLFEINPKNSLGAELSVWHNGSWGPTSTSTDLMDQQATVNTRSRFDNHDRGNNYTATFNYILKLDTLGSTLKLLADYTRRDADSGNDNSSRITSGPSVVDSLYRDAATSQYDIMTASLALEKNFSPRWTLKAGAKYTFNDMRNDALYEYRKADAWLRNNGQSYTVNYTENIAALYATASARLGRWSLVAGLRGEYTHTHGKSGGLRQNYFSLFPNANISYTLAPEKGHSLILQYARTIQRPNFWCLNPQRSQLSDYTYQSGNPSLDPAFQHDVNLTLVLANKYSLTGGVQIIDGEILQTMLSDPQNPDMLHINWVNFDATTSYYATVNLPFQPAKWWQMNLNGVYMRRGQRIEQHGEQHFCNWVFANVSNTFSLPARFYIDCAYFYQGRIDLGTVWVLPSHSLQAGIKKRLGEQFLLSLSVRGILDQDQRIGASGDNEDFVRMMHISQAWGKIQFRFGVTWNFQSGKAFRKRAVEAASAEDRERLSKGSGTGF